MAPGLPGLIDWLWFPVNFGTGGHHPPPATVGRAGFKGAGTGTTRNNTHAYLMFQQISQMSRTPRKKCMPLNHKGVIDYLLISAVAQYNQQKTTLQNQMYAVLLAE